ncbi:RanGTP-binding protein-domain-containing protein [Dimargaris cristalligena]|uniref:RanGTP-binding protein-domain-containing protein n=1 Tax=Dimargaris cristalligena TaxID=215637 RepID=A0A4V1J555_9FUNG|nr:RanGTP-binding protein-domain-containing protein [Dimargaris cristalligena]|eukprot:RKP37879.1 RanGTP-binding protein-domain-containing protein [Dimargaris cristalligena]
MDEMFTNLAIQTVTLVGKAAFGAAGTIALRKFSRFIQDAPTKQTQQLEKLRAELELRLRLVVPAIDLVDILAARGNSSLTAVVPLTTDLRTQTEQLSQHLEQLERQMFSNQRPTSRTDRKFASQFENAVEALQQEIQALLDRIAEMVPFLNLALTTSGCNLSAGMSSSISPARLLQASSSLQETHHHGLVYAIQPSFTLTLYSLFTSSVRHKSRDDFTWKEEFPKCKGFLQRIRSPDLAYSYELVIEEDLNDGRYHEHLDGPVNNSAPVPGDRRVFPVTDIVRLHYSSAGQLLNIEDSKRPVLVIQVQLGSGDLAPKPLALASSLASLSLAESATPPEESESEGGKSSGSRTPKRNATISGLRPAPTRQLSLLEYLLRLTALEMCEQTLHLDVSDEKLSLFLRDDQGPAASPNDPQTSGDAGQRLNSSGSVAWDLDHSIRKSYSRNDTPLRADYSSPLARRLVARNDNKLDTPLRYP